jgi:hypothetical protein
VSRALSREEVVECNRRFDEYKANGGDPHVVPDHIRLPSRDPRLTAVEELLDLAPPQDRQAELTVCGLVITSPALLDGAQVYDIHFANERIRTVFNQIRQMRTAGEPIDTAHVVANLERADVYYEIGGAAFIAEILTSADAAPSRFGEYVERLKELEARRRALHTSFAASRRRNCCRMPKPNSRFWPTMPRVNRFPIAP